MEAREGRTHWQRIAGGRASGQTPERFNGRRCPACERRKTAAPRQAKAERSQFFNAIQLFALLADPAWLDDATKTIGQFWRRKNSPRNGLAVEDRAEDKPPPARPKAKARESGVALEISCGEAATFFERKIFNTGNAAGNNDNGQIGAAIERASSDAGDAIGYGVSTGEAGSACFKVTWTP